VCGCAAGHHTGELAGNDRIAIGAADSVLWTFTERINAAWTFPADTTAEAEAAKTTLRLLCFIAVENGFDTARIRYGQKFYYAWIRGRLFAHHGFL
jgi:hypothetical protein